MKYLAKTVIAAGLVLTGISAPAFIAPVMAQTVKGIAVVNLQVVVLSSDAYNTAQQQRPVTYKAQFDQASARREAIAEQLQSLVTKFQSDSQQPNADQQALQQLQQQIQQIDQAGQRELQEILAPVSLSGAYVEEQINEQLSAALENAAKKEKVSLVLTRESIRYVSDDAYNLNQAVLDELNELLPVAQLVPPQGWMPREMREQQAAQAAQAAQAGQAPAQQPATAGR